MNSRVTPPLEELILSTNIFPSIVIDSDGLKVPLTTNENSGILVILYSEPENLASGGCITISTITELTNPLLGLVCFIEKSSKVIISEIASAFFLSSIAPLVKVISYCLLKSSLLKLPEIYLRYSLIVSTE